jgi:hypothetical protein
MPSIEEINCVSARADCSVLKKMVDDGLVSGASVVKISFGRDVAAVELASSFFDSRAEYSVGHIEANPFLENDGVVHNYCFMVGGKQENAGL